MSNNIEEFRQKVEELPREEIIDLIRAQDPELVKQLNRIEWVFANKLKHLGIEGRPLSKRELALIVDPPFMPNPDLDKMNISREQQRQVHIASDVVLWAKHFLDIEPRVYQILMMRDPSPRKVFRLGRRAGKTFTVAVILLHYAYTNNNGRCLVMAPMKSQVSLIYEEAIKLAKQGEVMESITRHIKSPQHEIHMSNGSSIRFFTTGMKCLTPDHDVLTRGGWKSIADVMQGEEILAWRDGKYDWEEVKHTWSYDFKGKLVTHSGRQISFRATPNHKFIAKTRYPGSKWRDVQAKDLKDYYIPTGASSVGATSSRYSKEELELWGWWISEGSGIIGSFTRFSQKKKQGIRRIQELLTVLGHEFKTYTYGDKASEIRTRWKPPIYSGKNCYDKFIPRALFEEEHLSSLLDGMLAGDGWMRNNGWEYSSSSWQLVNDAQEVAVRLGLRANLRKKNVTYIPVDGGAANPHWTVSAYDYRESVLNKSGLQDERYSGEVHCVTVPSGYFVVRHNGLVHVTGNSGGKADIARGQEAHIIVLDEMDYMGTDDLDALYAMLQRTDENQPEKLMIGASTPSGRRERFYEWATQSKYFKEFYFPAYVNPLWDRDTEAEMRDQYTEIAYRHEIEADWGEDAEGVYPRRYVDRAFLSPGWEYTLDERTLDEHSFYLMGVDWDKYGAGPNICVLEACREDHPDDRFAGRLRVAYREEIPRNEYVLTEAVNRIIELNKIFDPHWVYVDKGFGELQVELLHQYGVEHPGSGLKKKVRGVSFSETFKMRDPASKQEVKKEMKPFMVDNLRSFLERGDIVFPEEDEELYAQLISYIVVRTTSAGRPVFEASGSQEDHAHDALVLACLAYTQNYDRLMKVKLARHSRSISNELFLPIEVNEEDRIEKDYDYSEKLAPIRRRRRGVPRRSRGNIVRKKF